MTLKKLTLSKRADRWFCTGCGSPIKMDYHSSADQTWPVMSSIDLETLKGTIPQVKQHIYLQEKAPWVVLPDDGADRLQGE